MFDKWIYVILKMPMLEVIPFEEQKGIFAKLKTRAETAALTEEERIKCEYSLTIACDNLAVMSQQRLEGMNE